MSGIQKRWVDAKLVAVIAIAALPIFSQSASAKPTPTLRSIRVSPYEHLRDAQRVRISGSRWTTGQVVIEECYDDGTRTASDNCDSLTEIRVSPSQGGTFAIHFSLVDSLITPDGTEICSMTTGPKTNCLIAVKARHTSPAVEFIKFTYIPTIEPSSPYSNPGKIED